MVDLTISPTEIIVLHLETNMSGLKWTEYTNYKNMNKLKYLLKNKEIETFQYKYSKSML